MHFFFLTRGIKKAVKELEQDLAAQYFPFKTKDSKTGEEKTIYAKAGLRPIQLWEYIFPEESMQEVLNSLGIKEEDKKYNRFNKFLLILRKILKVEKLPKIETVPIRLIEHADVHILPIGIKKDLKDIPNKLGFSSEAL